MKGGSTGVLRECGGGAGMFRAGLADGVGLARSCHWSWRWPSGRRTACTQSVGPVQAAPDKGSCLVKLGPAGDC